MSDPAVPLPPADPERALAIGYAPPGARAALAALLDLDATLGRVVATTREPLVGQMRLTWWHDALSARDAGPPPAHPLLRTLAREVVARGVDGSELAGLVTGWEALLDEPLAEPQLRLHGVERGGRLFALAAGVLGSSLDPRLRAAGEGWAMVDAARHLRDAATATLALRLADESLPPGLRWPRPLRSLGALAVLATLNRRVPLGTAPPRGSPGRVLRLLRMRLTGY